MTDDGIVYSPERFYAPDLDQAKAIICTPEIGLSPDERWEKETAWLLPFLRFEPNDVVIDYGCGVGRIAKHLVCPVLGVDISLSMRLWADSYVNRSTFGAINPVMLGHLARIGLRADGAIAIWVLQHCYDLEFDIRLLAAALKPDAVLYVVNRPHRVVPVRQGDKEGWVDDGIDTDALLDRFFSMGDRLNVPGDLVAPGAHLTLWSRNEEETDLLAPRAYNGNKEIRL